jgi:hypothetical protein
VNKKGCFPGKEPFQLHCFHWLQFENVIETGVIQTSRGSQTWR